MNLKQEIVSLCLRYNVADLYAFGSRSKEVFAMVHGRDAASTLPGSDVDIGVLPANMGERTPENKVTFAMGLIG